MHGFYCLTFEGGPLTDVMRSLLFDTAQEMMDEGDESRVIKSGVGEGEVLTRGEQACLGCVSGTVFFADLDTVSGSMSVTYVVRPTRKFRAKDGFWIM